MPLKITERLFSFTRYIFFEGISVKFPPGSAKKLMDLLYVIFEKVTVKFDLISSSYLNMYQELVDKEIKMAGISSKDQVLVVGGGSLPITAVLIAMKKKSHVVVIDKDKKAVKDAVNYIIAHQLEDKVEIVCADANEYPSNNFDVIFLTYGLKKKEDIFNSLAKNFKNNSRIIFRTVIGSQKEKEKSIAELSKWFLVKDSINSDNLPPSGSYLLLKKN